MDKEALIHFFAGAAGGTVGTAFTCPLEVIKVRFQSSSLTCNSRIKIFKYITDIVRDEGFRALYKGLLPNIVGVAPSKYFYFFFIKIFFYFLHIFNIFLIIFF